MTVTDIRAGLERPVPALDKHRIDGKIEAADRRAFYFLVRAMDTRDLAYIAHRARTHASEDNLMPWHLSAYRAVRAELRRRNTGESAAITP